MASSFDVIADTEICMKPKEKKKVGKIPQIENRNHMWLCGAATI